MLQKPFEWLVLFVVFMSGEAFSAYSMIVVIQDIRIDLKDTVRVLKV